MKLPLSFFLDPKPLRNFMIPSFASLAGGQVLQEVEKEMRGCGGIWGNVSLEIVNYVASI